jgi:uncharacterized Fe-S cluster-containing radical SAM superfamily protein
MPHEMTRQSPAREDPPRFGESLTNAGGMAERDSAPGASAPLPGHASVSPGWVPPVGAGAVAARDAPSAARREPPGSPPWQPFLGLDAIWIQVAGSRCNLTCTHCFVSCGPAANQHAMLSRAEVAARVAESLALGVREVYLTGGEPFLHPAIERIVEDTLARAPVTVLTNGTLFTARRVEWLSRLVRAARHSLELRVSLDGTDAAAHDAFRGPGAWARTMRGLRALGRAGIPPIVTLTRPPHVDEASLAASALAALGAEGMRGARLKFLPLLPLGRELTRLGPAPPPRSLASLPREAFDPERLPCGRARAVTSRGVFACPLLVDEPAARMGDTLAASARAHPLAHDACVTCWVTGMTCAND